MTEKEAKIKYRGLIIGGSLIGAGLTIVVSLLMDLLYSDALQGTWRDAIVHDMQLYFEIQLSPKSLAVYAIFALVLFILSLIGAAIGALFVIVLHKFIRTLAS